MTRSRSRRWLIALVVVAGVPSLASAEVCPAFAGADPSATADVEQRLQFLARAFDREVRQIDIWSWTWGSVYAGATIAQATAIALTKDPGIHTDLSVGAVSAAVGTLSLTILPLQITLPLRKVRRDWNDPQRCQLLDRAEHVLLSQERDEALANGIVAHLGNVAANAGIALILGLGYGRWKSAAISAGVGLAIGETNAFTQPHHLKSVLQQYRSGVLDDADAKIAWSLVPVLTPELRGAALAVTW